jgi:hypothetical protein
MDDITRAVELTKARMLEIQAAYLTIMVGHKDVPKTYEGLKTAIEKAVREWKEQCQAIRYNIAEGIDPTR